MRQAYRHVDSARFKAIAAINENLSKAFRHDPIGALVEQLRVALQSECYATADAIRAYLMVHWPKLEPADKARIVPLALRCLVALGEVEAIRALLAQAGELAFENDYTLTCLSVYGLAPGAPGVSEHLATLPRSGRLNTFYLNQPERVCRAETFGIAARALASGGPAETLLLLANHHAANGSHAMARDLLNRFLDGRGVSTLGRTVFEPGRFFPELTFEKALPESPDGPLVSVVMSAYMAAGTIGYALDAITAQSHRNIEVLVCVDDSPDETLAIARAAAQRDGRVRIFRSKGNQGPYNIRNQMLAQAGGAYITFADADDIAMPERIETQLAAIRGGAQGADGTDTAATPAGMKVASKARWLRLRPDGQTVFFGDGLAQRPCLNSLMVRAEVFKRTGPFVPVMFGGDTVFYERLRALFGSDAIAEVDQPLVLGLWGEGSLTRQEGSAAHEDGYRAPARRAFAEIVFRNELRSPGILADGDSALEAELSEAGLLTPPTGSEPADRP
ncbi:glycosyltransferase family 2 protein [Profundibacterium mesophilum]|uniref:Lacto-N-neotetraose biosynthesis glycosyl transferase LgtA n=1 Tax=Profundibacterium mesophilum KAUST100406-0324 TaxID=1037889 RepID=A0A921NPF7_9RHOB|nr:glycosyltransferase family 2 protein [Profundibacterium mesophilum]KAF0674585.1 Lacto-N-neotetraose biosynthesis glycosyl transferase LgtA [Profundibacterium mesophilum KAUST100406-0324]